MEGYFDNAATSYKKPIGMYEFIADYMKQYGANIGRGGYESSKRGSAVLFETRKKLLDMMRAPATKTVAFMPSATVALNTILYGANFIKDDVIYISNFEHNAILRPLYDLEKTVGIKIKFLPMSNEDKFSFDLKQMELDFIKDKPKVVIVSHVSNVFGAIAPVERIALLAKRFNAVTVVDGAQSCSVLECDLTNIDFFVFAGHKTLLGPTGIGGFICNKNTALNSFIKGGTGIDSANSEMPKNVPERFEAGTMNLMAIAGLNYSLDWILKNKSYIQDAERKNLDILYNILKNYDFMKIISPYPNSSSIISCQARGFTSDEFGIVLAERGIAVRTGLHCAPEAHKYLNTFPEGTIRFSISCFTDEQDFISLQKTLDDIALSI
ncbi:MAG: aminotransferase class V-fold PLP-dependent enzyme [Clostridiales bacterium]|nr:aminotransferase class V-fold PLP-dependent enzyme [Clostridiales bacterium]